jgi:hypothetical protein
LIEKIEEGRYPLTPRPVPDDDKVDEEMKQHEVESSNNKADRETHAEAAAEQKRRDVVRQRIKQLQRQILQEASPTTFVYMSVFLLSFATGGCARQFDYARISF